jgi:hypothetical protein
MMNEQPETPVIQITRGRKKLSRIAPNDPRPTIHLTAGQTERIVDEAEDALMKANRGLYQRENLIVTVGHAPALAADGREVVALRIFTRGDHALLEDLAAAARFERFDKRVKGNVAADPPLAIVKTLKQRLGKLRFPILSGVVTAPTMRPDGSILSLPGYDPQTGLLLEPSDVEFQPIPERPTRADAEKAFATLCHLIEEFPFVEPHDRSVALSAILTACIRPSLPTAPMHVFSAPVAGSGKSKLVDLASVIATGHEAAVVAQGATEEELEKRLGSMLLAGVSVISVDNCEHPLGGELLCQMLTQARVRTRILGASETPELSPSAFIAATGNNLLLQGDLTRRAILCRLDPKVERPEMRVFEHEPVATAKAQRGDLVVAALTVLRAYHMSGRPGAPTPLGSFETWSDLVRGALLWMGAADPVESMNEIRKADPSREAIRAVCAQWYAEIGPEVVTVADVIRRAIDMRQGNEFVRPDLREALLAVAGRGGALNSRALGNWLSSQKDRIVDGFSFTRMGDRQGVAAWELRRS